MEDTQLFTLRAHRNCFYGQLGYGNQDVLCFIGGSASVLETELCDQHKGELFTISGLRIWSQHGQLGSKLCNTVKLIRIVQSQLLCSLLACAEL